MDTIFLDLSITLGFLSLVVIPTVLDKLNYQSYNNQNYIFKFPFLKYRY